MKISKQVAFQGLKQLFSIPYIYFSHSWAIPTQRYAYDFVVMDDEGRTHLDDNTELTSYGCYGKNALAPADGVVISIGNICKDEKPFKDGTIEVTAKDIRGNYILIKHAEKEYGFIGHLQPQSCKEGI